MNSRSSKRKKMEKLRAKAEELLSGRGAKNGVTVPVEEIGKLVHELDVYEVELEMQNQDLITTQQQLEESLERYTDLFENAPVGYCTLDVNGLISEINRTGESILERNRDCLSGKPFQLYIARDSRNDYNRFLRTVLASPGKTRSIELKLLKKDENEFYAFLEIVTLGKVKYRPRQIRITFQDITKRKMLESQNQELSDFTFRVSHDLKSPIHILAAYLDILEENGPDPAVFKTIKTQLKSLSTYIEKLLALSRAGRVIGTREKISLEPIIKLIVSELPVKDIPLHVDLNLEVKEIMGDIESLLVIFQNIFENSVKYRDPDKEQLEITVRNYQKRDSVIFEIQDNGTGIEKEYLQQIFQPGYTLSRDKGTGFGLAIVKKIVLAYNGSTKVLSDGKNMGTRFIIKFPLHQE